LWNYLLFDMLLQALSLLLLPLTVLAGGGSSPLHNLDESIDIQMEGLERMLDFLGPDSMPKPRSSGTVKREITSSTITFSNPAAKQFEVDGTKIPDGEIAWLLM
jgi:hypothetical protein